MKRISYLLVFIISIFIYNNIVSAQGMVGDGQWHEIAMKPFTLGSSSWTPYCEIKGDRTNTAEATAKVLKNSDGTYSCAVKASKKGSFNIEWGALTDDGVVGVTIYGSSSVSVSPKKSEDDPSTPSTPTPKTPETDSSEFYEICSVTKNPQLLATFKLVGIFVTIIKVVVPIILIFMGSIDLTQAVISHDNDAIIKSIIVFGKRGLAGILVFLAPSVLQGLFHMVDGMDNYDSKYKKCVDCALGSKECPDVHFVQE